MPHARVADEPVVEEHAASELELALGRLEDEERALSAQRRRLQDRIDLFLGGGAPEAVAEDEMRELRQRERELSERRREVHAQIAALRLRSGRS
jgi:hypothetical protein